MTEIVLGMSVAGLVALLVLLFRSGAVNKDKVRADLDEAGTKAETGIRAWWRRVRGK